MVIGTKSSGTGYRYLFGPRANALGNTTFENIERLTEEFSTSITATAIRLVEYGPESAILVCHGPKGRKWFNRPRPIPERWFPRHDLDADSYALDILYGTNRCSRRVLMDAEAWFDRRDASQFEIFEQSFKVADDEILSLLILKDEEMLEDTE